MTGPFTSMHSMPTPANRSTTSAVTRSTRMQRTAVVRARRDMPLPAMPEYLYLTSRRGATSIATYRRPQLPGSGGQSHPSACWRVGSWFEPEHQPLGTHIGGGVIDRRPCGSVRDGRDRVYRCGGEFEHQVRWCARRIRDRRADWFCSSGPPHQLPACDPRPRFALSEFPAGGTRRATLPHRHRCLTSSRQP